MTKEEVKNIVRHVFHFYEVHTGSRSWTDMNEACGEILKALDQESILDEIAKEVSSKSYLSYDDNPRHIIDEDWVLEIINKYKADLRGDEL